jgi:hypothetical protein
MDSEAPLETGTSPALIQLIFANVGEKRWRFHQCRCVFSSSNTKYNAKGEKLNYYRCWFNCTTVLPYTKYNANNNTTLNQGL